MQSQRMISALDLASRSANMELEFEASIARLEAMCDTLCASTRDRLTRRVNRIPATLRATPIIDILAPSPATAPSAAAINAPAASSSSAPVSRPKQATKPAPKKALKTARKPDHAPPAKPAPKPHTKFSSSPVPSRHTAIRSQKRTSDEISGDNKENSPVVTNKRARTNAPAAKPAPKPHTKFSSSPVPSRHTAIRSQKRTSDEISGDNKENSPVVTNKRARTNAAPKTATKTATKTKAAPTTRATRAASRQQTAQVLSPKNNNVRAKNTKTTTRPR